MPCPTCSGEGVVITSPCKKCRGEGRVRGEHTIPVQIPAGVATGQYMTLRGMGNAGPRGGPRGDILVVFEVQEDPRFERDGEDLYCEVLVSYPQLVLGADIEVPTVTGTMSVRLPRRDAERAGSAPARARSAARERSGSGDLHVRVQLWTPDARHDVGRGARRGAAARCADQRPCPSRPAAKGFWAKMREALGA